VEGADRQGGVVAALGLQRDAVAEGARQTMRPGAGGDDEIAGRERAAVGERHPDAARPGRRGSDLGAAEFGTALLRMGPYRLAETLRVGDRFPAGNEGAFDEARRKPRLQGFETGALDMPIVDAEALPRVPPRQRGGELGLAL